MLMTGMFHRSLDDKLRFAVPKQFRAAMNHPDNSVLYLAPGTDGSLELYTEAVFERITHQMEEGSRQDRSRRAFNRVFYAQVQRVELDRQGRVRLPLELARLASINKELVLVGVRDHVEIWDRGRWDEFLRNTQPHFDELAERTAPITSPSMISNQPGMPDSGETTDSLQRPAQPR